MCLTAEPTPCDKAYTGDYPHLMHQSFVSTALSMHQSFVSTAPSPTGMGGDSDFSLFRVLWGQAEGNNPTLSPALHYRKSHRGKCPNVKTPAVPRYCGVTIQNGWNNRISYGCVYAQIRSGLGMHLVTYSNHDTVLFLLIVPIKGRFV